MTTVIKIELDFSKTEIGITTTEYLNEIVDSEELKDNLNRALAGKNLKVKEANQLIQSLLAAIVINGGEGDKAIKNSIDKVLMCY